MDFTFFTLDNIRRLPLWFSGGVVAVFAGMLGSFVNVCIYRIPRGESIVTPRSRCPACGHALGIPDLVPILSWLFLAGRCRHCGVPVSARYTLVELAVVAIWLVPFIALGPGYPFVLASSVATVVFTMAGVLLYSRSIETQPDKRGATAACGPGDSAGASTDPSSDGVAAGTPAGGNTRKGLTFLEILFTAVILAAVVGPFLNVNWTGRAGAVRNRERIIAYGLAREKLEELRCVPARRIRGDWLLYRGEGSGLSSNIFRDEIFGVWAKMDEDKDLFWRTMSDVLTGKGQCGSETMPETVFEKFKRNFRRYYGFEYECYPDSYRIFRRTTRVDDLTLASNPGNVLKRVTVTVIIDSKVHSGYEIKLASYFSDN